MVKKLRQTQMVPLTPKLAVAWPPHQPKKPRVVPFTNLKMSAASQTSIPYLTSQLNCPSWALRSCKRRELLQLQSDNNSLFLFHHRLPFNLLVAPIRPSSHLLVFSQFQILPSALPSSAQLRSTAQTQTSAKEQAKAIF